VLTATGAAKFNWYKSFTGGAPIFSGPVFTTPPLQDDILFYVSNADNHYESLRIPAVVDIKARPEIHSSGDMIFCEGSTVVLSVEEADEYTWSTGEKTQSIEVASSGEYTVKVRNNTLECESMDTVGILVNDLPSSIFTFEPQDPVANKDVFFSAAGAGGVIWQWDFGDGSTSSEQNPTHVFDELGDYTVTLTATSVEGCNSTSSLNIGIITSTEGSFANSFDVYPNPVSDKIALKFNAAHEVKDISIHNSQGKRMRTFPILEGDHLTIDVSTLSEGIYLLKIDANGKSAIKKIAIVR
jgi:hypothetical protein